MLLGRSACVNVFVLRCVFICDIFVFFSCLYLCLEIKIVIGAWHAVPGEEEEEESRDSVFID